MLVNDSPAASAAVDINLNIFNVFTSILKFIAKSFGVEPMLTKIILQYLHFQFQRDSMTPSIITLIRGGTVAIILSAMLAVPTVSQARDCSVPLEIDDLRIEHLGKLNALRKRQSVNTVSTNNQLDAIAQKYACLLAETGHFDHVGPYGSTLAERARDGDYEFCQIAENLAKGQQSVNEALMGWITSVGHWKNLVRATVEETGFGVAYVGPAREIDPSGPQTLSELATSLDGKPRKSVRRPAGATRNYVWVQLFGKSCR